MINPCTESPRSARRAWSGTVQQLFESLDLQERETAAEISESLAVFCEQFPHMPGHTLSLLMARSFCAIGDRAAADRILRHDRAHRSHADSWLDVLSAEYPFPELYPLFSSRALHPIRLQTVGSQTVWVLDFGRVLLTDADRHEIILLQTLRTLTEKVSNVWKKSNGQGTLAVKGLSRLSLAARPRSAQNLPEYLRRVLARRAALCGWPSVPSVLTLDL
jgi:hypothetical protein